MELPSAVGRLRSLLDSNGYTSHISIGLPEPDDFSASAVLKRRIVETANAALAAGDAFVRNSSFAAIPIFNDSLFEQIEVLMHGDRWQAAYLGLALAAADVVDAIQSCR